MPKALLMMPPYMQVCMLVSTLPTPKKRPTGDLRIFIFLRKSRGWAVGERLAKTRDYPCDTRFVRLT